MDFVDVLMNEYQSRLKRNDRYSLRAYAKSLGVDASMLSKYFRRERVVSPKSVCKMGSALGLDSRQIKIFQGLSSKIIRDRKVSASTDDEFQKIAASEKKIILKWYYYAILELMETHNFQSDSKWIGRRLSLDSELVAGAIRNLVELGFIEKNSQGRLVNVRGQNTTLGSCFSGEELRDLQKQFLKKANDALEQIPMNLRSQSSLTFAFDRKNISEIQNHIRLFRRRINKLALRCANEGTDVYNISISLYPLTAIDV